MAGTGNRFMLFDLRLDFFQIIKFDHIAAFDVVEILDTDAALVPALDLFDIVLESSQG
jgi:hypothetical protein